jgi:hypothetical protein
MCPADPFGCRLSTVGLPMFPSEITPPADRVGLAVGETVPWLYVGSVEDVGGAGAVDTVAVEGVGGAGAVDPVAVEGVGGAGAVDPVAVERLVTGEPGSVEPPEGDSCVRDETAELSAPEEQAVVSEAHRIAITAVTQRRRHMWARRTFATPAGERPAPAHSRQAAACPPRRCPFAARLDCPCWPRPVPPAAGPAVTAATSAHPGHAPAPPSNE